MQFILCKEIEMKYLKIALIILLILIFTTGCTDLVKDPYSREDRMKFKENITINYGKKNVDTTKFVTGYDSYTISDVNRHTSSKTITIDNYTIKCPSFSADKMGKQSLIYKVDKYKYTLTVNVKDKEKPTIDCKKDVDYTIGDKISIKKLFEIKDNLTENKDLKIQYKGKVKNKVGKYKITCTVEDEAGNESKAATTVHIYEKPTLSISSKALILKTNQNAQIKALVTGKESQCTYSSENEGIATVNENGLVKAIGSGQTIIHVKANGLEEKVTVNVEAVQQTTPSSSNESNSNKNNNTNSSTNNNSSNSSGSASSSSSQTNNNKTSSGSSSNPSQYNRYFSCNSIDSYNSAYSYAESIMSSGKANGYSVMPDGNGFNVTFS